MGRPPDTRVAVRGRLRRDARRPGLYRLGEWVWKPVAAGVVYGLVLPVVGAGIVMPIRLGVAGVSMATSIPNVTVPLLVWHVVYGVVLGGLFPSLEEL